MKRMAAMALAVGLILAILSGPSAAQEAAPDNAVQAVVTGLNYCVPCALKAQGAEAACEAGGHQHALKVTDIRDAEGNYIRGFVNKTIYYLNNPKGTELNESEELHEKTVTVEGTLFKDERILDVKDFKEAAGGAGGVGPSTSTQVGAPPVVPPAQGN
jgi:hypothetical protein